MIYNHNLATIGNYIGFVAKTNLLLHLHCSDKFPVQGLINGVFFLNGIFVRGDQMMQILLANPNALNTLPYRQKQQTFKTFGNWYKFTNEKNKLITELQNISNYELYECLNSIVQNNTPAGVAAATYITNLITQHGNTANNLL